MDMKLTPTFSIGFGQTAPEQLRGMPIPDQLTKIHNHVVRAGCCRPSFLTLPEFGSVIYRPPIPRYCRRGDKSLVEDYPEEELLFRDL